MKIHEYQAKGILKKYGVAVPRGEMADEPSRRRKPRRRIYSSAGASGVVVKAQIHAGGRGKGGGVKIAKSVEEAAELASQDIGHDAGDASDRSRGPRSAAPADRRDSADRERTLSRES